MRKKLLLVAVMVSSVVIFGADFAQDFKAAKKLYQARKFAEAEEMLVKLSKQTTSQVDIDKSLEYAAYCAEKLKKNSQALGFAGKIQDKSLNMLCRMNLLKMQKKWKEIVLLSKDVNIAEWPDSLKYAAFICRGEPYARMKNIANAEKDFLAAGKNTQVKDDKAFVYQRLGNCYKSSSKQNALEAYGKVVEIMSDPKPSNSKGMLGRALIARSKLFLSLDKPKDALGELGKLKELNLTDPYWTYLLSYSYGEVYESMKRNDKALEHFRKVQAFGGAPKYLLKKANKRITDIEKRTP